MLTHIHRNILKIENICYILVTIKKTPIIYQSLFLLLFKSDLIFETAQKLIHRAIGVSKQTCQLLLIYI